MACCWLKRFAHSSNLHFEDFLGCGPRTCLADCGDRYSTNEAQLMMSFFVVIQQKKRLYLRTLFVVWCYFYFDVLLLDYVSKWKCYFNLLFTFIVPICCIGNVYLLISGLWVNRHFVHHKHQVGQQVLFFYFIFLIFFKRWRKQTFLTVSTERMLKCFVVNIRSYNWERSFCNAINSGLTCHVYLFFLMIILEFH